MHAYHKLRFTCKSWTLDKAFKKVISHRPFKRFRWKLAGFLIPILPQISKSPERSYGEGNWRGTKRITILSNTHHDSA